MPWRLLRFQNRAHSMAGPKVAPKPAQAKETIWNTELLGFQASTAPTTAMMTTVPRANSMEVLLSILIPRKLCTRSSDMEEAAARSWESAVDMVLAMMPAKVTPASREKATPYWLSSSASLITMVSESELVVSVTIRPALDTPKPTTPMRTATPMAITTQMEPTRREMVSFSSSSMDMKRTRMWGIPK